MTLLLILAQIEFRLGNSHKCNELCDALLGLDNSKIEALEMKGDICRHFCQIDQAFFYYSKAIENNTNKQDTNIS
jgi:tetratricopeptide (TPR) repeat protein|tara:strand:- start:707 stop:931 length:225 start_codon:yes stop_codon:yes gene_type:complete